LAQARNYLHKPGTYTERLRTALGMAEGAPPPWLINMQRYGPPPVSYHVTKLFSTG
jgi:splicing factor 3B subunit 2